jgi:DNA-binding CsgD family transcriptional regulator
LSRTNISVRQDEQNKIYSYTQQEVDYGDITGSITVEETAIVHPDNTTNFYGTSTCSCTVDGKSGTLMYSYNGTSTIENALYEHSMAAVRSRLGEKAFIIEWTKGRTMSLEQALTAQEHITTMKQPVPPSSATPPCSASPTRLTKREVEVLRLVAQGLTDSQVAERLVISPRTVNFHLTSIYRKLAVSSRAAATRYAIEHHLV